MTLNEIIEQLESCNYECEAGPLENNVAWQQLKRMAEGHVTLNRAYVRAIEHETFRADYPPVRVIEADDLELVMPFLMFHIAAKQDE